MMKVLLANPPGPWCRAGSRWPHRRKTHAVGIDYHPFPFGLVYGAARLRADGHTPRVLDCIALDMDLPALIREAETFQPDVVFMETSAPSFRDDVEAMKALKLPCIAGGPHATATISEHLDAGFTAVIRGEYDQVLSQAVTFEPQPWLATTGHPDATHVDLVWQIDSCPSPAWDLFPMERYNDPFCRGRSVTVLSTRGCPYQCGFCTIAPYAGMRNFRTRDPKKVCDEISLLIEKFHPDEVYFDDDTITANRQHLLDLCAEYKARGFGIPFSCMGNASVDPDLLLAMADAGCRAFKFGVETGDPEVMAQIPKNLDLDEVVRTVKDCHHLGIQTHATYLLGLPGETTESAHRTIDFALRLHTHTLQFAIATPYPGTAFYEKAVANGWLTRDSWLDFDPAARAVVSYPDYPAEAIEAMHDIAWKRWQWHMLTRRPATLAHHFTNAWRREGMAGVSHLAAYGLRRLLILAGKRP